MPRRPLHQLAPSGATDGQAPLFNDTANEYAPGDVVLEIVEGPGVSVDATDPKRPIVSASGDGITGLTSADASVTITDNGDGTLDLAAVGGGGAAREVLMASGVSFPAEPVESSTGGDWLYGGVSS